MELIGCACVRFWLFHAFEPASACTTNNCIGSGSKCNTTAATGIYNKKIIRRIAITTTAKHIINMTAPSSCLWVQGLSLFLLPFFPLTMFSFFFCWCCCCISILWCVLFCLSLCSFWLPFYIATMIECLNITAWTYVECINTH